MLLLISDTDARCRCRYSVKAEGDELQAAIAKHIEKCPHKDYDGITEPGSQDDSSEGTSRHRRTG